MDAPQIAVSVVMSTGYAFRQLIDFARRCGVIEIPFIFSARGISSAFCSSTRQLTIHLNLCRQKMLQYYIHPSITATHTTNTSWFHVVCVNTATCSDVLRIISRKDGIRIVQFRGELENVRIERVCIERELVPKLTTDTIHASLLTVPFIPITFTIRSELYQPLTPDFYEHPIPLHHFVSAVSDMSMGSNRASRHMETDATTATGCNIPSPQHPIYFYATEHGLYITNTEHETVPPPSPVSPPPPPHPNKKHSTPAVSSGIWMGTPAPAHSPWIFMARIHNYTSAGLGRLTNLANVTPTDHSAILHWNYTKNTTPPILILETTIGGIGTIRLFIASDETKPLSNLVEEPSSTTEITVVGNIATTTVHDDGYYLPTHPSFHHALSSNNTGTRIAILGGSENVVIDMSKITNVDCSASGDHDGGRTPDDVADAEDEVDAADDAAEDAAVDEEVVVESWNE